MGQGVRGQGEQGGEERGSEGYVILGFRIPTTSVGARGEGTRWIEGQGE